MLSKRLCSHCTDEYAAKARGLLTNLDLLISSLDLSFKTVFVKFTSQNHNCSGSNVWSRFTHCLNKFSELKKNLVCFLMKLKKNHTTSQKNLLFQGFVKYLDNMMMGQRHITTPKDRYRHIYFEVLEVIAGEIERRFNQPGLKTIKDVEQLVINASNNEKFDIND